MADRTTSTHRRDLLTDAGTPLAGLGLVRAGAAPDPELQPHGLAVVGEKRDAGILEGGLQGFEGGSVRGGLAALEATNGRHANLGAVGQIVLFPA